MKKIALVLFIFFVLILSSCSAPKSYNECDTNQKAILRAASSFGYNNRSIKDTKMDGDAVLILDTKGNDYEFIPLCFTSGGVEQKEVAMFKGESFIGFASDEIPLKDVLNYESLSKSRQQEVYDLMKCFSVWSGYKDFGKEVEGRNVGTDDLIIQIKSVTIVKARSLSAIFQNWAVYN